MEQSLELLITVVVAAENEEQAVAACTPFVERVDGRIVRAVDCSTEDPGCWAVSVIRSSSETVTKNPSAGLSRAVRVFVRGLATESGYRVACEPPTAWTIIDDQPSVHALVPAGERILVEAWLDRVPLPGEQPQPPPSPIATGSADTSVAAVNQPEEPADKAEVTHALREVREEPIALPVTADPDENPVVAAEPPPAEPIAVELTTVPASEPGLEDPTAIPAAAFEPIALEPEIEDVVLEEPVIEDAILVEGADSMESAPAQPDIEDPEIEVEAVAPEPEPLASLVTEREIPLARLRLWVEVATERAAPAEWQARAVASRIVRTATISDYVQRDGVIGVGMDLGQVDVSPAQAVLAAVSALGRPGWSPMRWDGDTATICWIASPSPDSGVIGLELSCSVPYVEDPMDDMPGTPELLLPEQPNRSERFSF
ncbi:hypothetical protein D5S17_29355 [Pseudonocardiaceae bacterium YIM PH 21723]|nr:hypothetical protein D5S17_29355 [Pseudonocardiaceae bacterium YIM PH 21723]